MTSNDDPYAYDQFIFSHVLRSELGPLIAAKICIALIEDLLAVYFQSFTTNSDFLLVLAFSGFPIYMHLHKAALHLLKRLTLEADLCVDV